MQRMLRLLTAVGPNKEAVLDPPKNRRCPPDAATDYCKALPVVSAILARTMSSAASHIPAAKPQASSSVEKRFAGRCLFDEMVGGFGYNSPPDKNPGVRWAGVTIISLDMPNRSEVFATRKEKCADRPNQNSLNAMIADNQMQSFFGPVSDGMIHSICLMATCKALVQE